MTTLLAPARRADQIREGVTVANSARYGSRRPAPAPQAPYGSYPAGQLPGGAGQYSDWSTPTAVRTDAAGPAARPAEPTQTFRGRHPRIPRAEQLSERGLPWWGALLVLLAIAGVGGILDTVSGGQARGGFNWGIVIASVVAIVIVRRSGMFPIVIAPPIVYSLGSGSMLYIRSGGLHDKRVLFDGAANWLVYGFPAIAIASACVLIIAGIRLIARR
jgi:hypothetical protein